MREVMMSDPWLTLASAAHPAQMMQNAHQLATGYAAWWLSGWDQLARLGRGSQPIPPLWLRYRVQGAPSISTYLEVGRYCEKGMVAALWELNRSIDDFSRVLDFGCGCARTLQWLMPSYPNVSFAGTDVDAEAIAWCQEHFPAASFSVNGHRPPLPHPAESFDFVYALSVFTHLDEEAQFAWLAELKRVLKPNGLMLLSFLGFEPSKVDALPQREALPEELRAAFGKMTVNPWLQLSDGDIDRLRCEGFAWVQQQFAPDGLGDAFHTEEYVRTRYGDGLEVLSYEKAALAGFQDVAVLRKL
jgi:SAM-dependent methyltransferase